MNYYDGISKGYNELYGEEQKKKALIVRDLLEISKNDILLDVGCGSAVYFPLFRCKRIGLDPSIELLKLAKNGIFVHGVAENLPFVDNCFDIVISITALHNFSDIRKALVEMKRVARGSVVVSVLNNMNVESILSKIFKVKSVINEGKDIVYEMR